MRALLSVLATLTLAACSLVPPGVDPRSDEPAVPAGRASAVDLPATYAQALGTWRSPIEVNTWIATRFEYDRDRAIQLSENQRGQGPRVAIHEPGLLYSRPSGVCIDLARFAVETLRITTPSARATYLMIEFEPIVIAGNTLRRHWVAQYEVDDKFYFFADSKRPGYVAGPFGTVREFIEQYSQYRQRKVIAYKSLESYERQLQKKAPKSSRGQRV